MSRFRRCLALLAIGCTPLALAQEGTSLESDWLEFVTGSKGSTMGVELREIQPGDTAGTQRIVLAVPKKAISHPDTIEEVVVVGRAPEKPEPLDIRYEWLDDYDQDNYGLVIHIGESRWPIRLYMNSSPGYIRQEGEPFQKLE
jgi:hypothetical protein